MEIMPAMLIILLVLLQTYVTSNSNIYKLYYSKKCGISVLISSSETNSHRASEGITGLYQVRSFVVVLTRTSAPVSILIRLIELTPSQAASLRFILIISPHQRLGLPSDLFPSDFSNFIRISYLYSAC
jgi:hypothetical protein